MVKNNFRKYLEKKNYYISCAWLNCNFGALAQCHGVKCEQILQEIIRFDVLIAGKKRWSRGIFLKCCNCPLSYRTHGRVTW